MRYCACIESFINNVLFVSKIFTLFHTLAQPCIYHLRIVFIIFSFLLYFLLVVGFFCFSSSFHLNNILSILGFGLGFSRYLSTYHLNIFSTNNFLIETTNFIIRHVTFNTRQKCQMYQLYQSQL